MQLPVKEMSIKDIDYIINSSRTNILYLIFPKYNEKLWLDFWNHPQIVEHFIKQNKPHTPSYDTEVNTPKRFKEIYKYHNDTSKHIIINLLTRDSRLPITQSTLSTENPHESVIKYLGLSKGNTEIIRMIDEPEEKISLETLLFGGDDND